MSDDGYVLADVDAEDAWDDGDPVDARLAVLERVVETIADDPARLEARRVDALRLVAKLSDDIPRGPRRRRLRRVRDALEAMG